MNQHNQTDKQSSNSDSSFKKCKCFRYVLSFMHTTQQRQNSGPKHFTLHPHTTSLDGILNGSKDPTSLGRKKNTFGINIR